MFSDRITLVLNLNTLQLQGPVARIDITDPESLLLCALVAAPGYRMQASALLQHCGMPVIESGKRALGVRVVRLRKKLIAAGANEPTIKSIRGTGYQLCVPLSVADRDSHLSSSTPRSAIHV